MAYEVRISDWSSDVCSSDLNRDDGKQPKTKSPVAMGGLEAVAHHAHIKRADTKPDQIVRQQVNRAEYAALSDGSDVLDQRHRRREEGRGQRYRKRPEQHRGEPAAGE